MQGAALPRMAQQHSSLVPWKRELRLPVRRTGKQGGALLPTLGYLGLTTQPGAGLITASGHYFPACKTGMMPNSLPAG